MVVRQVTETPQEPGAQPLDIGALSLDDAPKPDHTASAEPRLSVVDRVRAKAQERADETKTSTRSSTRSKSKKAPRKTRDGELVKPLTEIYTTLGMVLVPFDNVCSLAVIENAEKCARSLDKLAQENDAVRRVVLGLMETSAWGGVLMAHMPLLLMVMVHHAPKNVAETLEPMAAMMNPTVVANLAANDDETPEAKSA